MTHFRRLQEQLRSEPRHWLITGVAGFIGSNLLEALLVLDQEVVGLDNFSTGKRQNLLDVQRKVPQEQWRRFTFVEGDIRDYATCRVACRGREIVLHEAALGSVPRSIEDPLTCNDNNVTGTLNMLMAARDEGVKRLVYAASSAVYGDHPSLPKVEFRIGRPLSPYAVSKYVNELYAEVFTRLFGLESIGLRYFNVFGPRQDPDGAYAAVIPRWIGAMVRGEEVYINGTGETSRDYCYVENVVQINILAALAENRDALNQVYNAALNRRTTLNELFVLIRDRLLPHCDHLRDCRPVYRPFRQGDVLHSQADIDKAARLLGYAPTHPIDAGLDAALEWYLDNLEKQMERPCRASSL